MPLNPTMAAILAVRSHYEVSRDSGHLQRKMPQQKTGLDDEMNAGRCSLAMKRCASTCMERDLALEETTPLSSEVRKSSVLSAVSAHFVSFRHRNCGESRGRNGHFLQWERTEHLTIQQVQCLKHLENIKAILDSLDAVVPDSAGSTESPHFDPPPSYKDSIADQPPNYEFIDDPVLAQATRYYPIPPPAYSYRSPQIIVPLFQMTAPDIDFGDTSNVRQVANKKKDKQQKKQADAAKWNDEGGEGNAEGGEGGDENDGGGAGGGNHGDGGAGDDGGGGDDWNSWDTGKKGKKGKKAKEEEKKRQEEEEEKKRKEEEQTNKVGHLDWADDANGDVGDDWAAFTTTTTKKGKKDKKGKVSKNSIMSLHATAHVPKIEPTTNGTSEFADISLHDNAPKIDLSFDQTETKDSGSFGQFGGWGGGGGPWNTGSNWNFNGADTATTDIADSFARATQDSAADTTDNNNWSFGGNKKNQKKKTTSSGFDSFNFGALNEEVEDEKAEENKVEGNGYWGTSTATGKKEKKGKKKGAFDDISNDPDPNTIGTALADPEPVAGDSWNAWGDTSAKKKKGKKGEEEWLAASQTAAAVNVSTEPAAHDWLGFDTKKAGKKGKKIMDVDEQAIVAAPEPEAESDAVWATFGKKDKKKGKKETEKVEDVADATVPEAELEFDFGKGSFGKKDNKKKGGKKEAETMDEPTSALSPDPDPGLDFGFDSLGKKDDKKGKKGKKELEKVEEPTKTAFQESEAAFDMSFGSWGKTDDKKTKKGKKEPEKVVESMINTFPKKGKKDDMSEAPAFTTAPEPEAETDIGWGTFTKKEVKKKGKKDNDKTEELSTKEPDPEPTDDWTPFGKKENKDKKKAKKSNVFDEPEKEVDKIIEEAHEPEIDFGWGAPTSIKEKKKSKKDAVEEIKPVEAEPLVDEKQSLMRSGSTKGKKGKKGLVTEVEEDLMPAIGSKFGMDSTSVAADDDWTSSFGTDKKKDKKNKRNSLASTGSKGDEAPPPPPPVPDVPDTSSFDVWGTTNKDKDKKGKKGKVAEPDLTAALEAEGKKNIVEDDFASWASLPPRERRKKEKEKKDREMREAREKEEAEEKERKEQEEAEEKERKEKEEAEEREREEKEKKSKGKLGKKGKISTSPVVSKTKNLLADSIPDVAAVEEDDKWGASWGAGPFKKDTKKGGRKDMLWETPPPAPTPPNQGLTPEPEEDAEGDDQDDNWGDYAPAKTTTKGKKDVRKDGKEDLKAGKKGMKEKMGDVIDETSKKDEMKKKDVSKEETPAKAARNFWGNVATTPASKSKLSGKDKEKVAREAKETEEKAEEYDDYDDEEEEDEDEQDEEMVDMLNEEPPMAHGGRLWKTSTKDSDKASKGSNSAEKGKGKGGKSKELETEGVDDEPKVKGKGFNSNSNGNTVAFSPWAASTSLSSKKTTGNKADILISGKKEIGAKSLTNQKTTGSNEVSNDPEPTNIKDDQPPASQALKSSKSAMSTSKSTTKTSSVLQRVKEIEKEKGKAPSSAPPVHVDPEPSSNFDIKAGASGKNKDLASSKITPAKTKDLPPSSKTKKKTSKEEAVPGSFPGEAMDDDFNNLDELLNDDPPLEKKESKKTAKSIKDPKLTSKTRDMPELIQAPTPPPEIKEEKPVKKERPRIAKEGGASSWGLWGAAPPKKKETKSKDDADILSPPKKEKASTPGFTRSKSTRTAKEKDKATVKSDSRSSDSDKPKKTESRPPKSRGSSFGAALFGPPIRTKSVRKNSTAASATKSASSRRQSVDVDATGLPSPPAEEAPDMASKAAKMMGTAKLDRKASTRGKQKAPGKKAPAMFEMHSDTADSGNPVVPDPYPIDSDDMVMVNDIDGALLDGKKTSTAKDIGSKNKSKGNDAEPGSSSRKDLPDRTKSKLDSKMDPGSSKRKSKIGNDFEDDVVMVDAGSSGDAGVEPGPDDMQFITKPKGFQRSATSSKKIDSKSGGSGGGLFGAFRKNRRATEVNELPKSRGTVEDEEISPRKRTVSGGNDAAKRPRRDDRRKSDKVDRAADGYVYDTARDVGGVTEAEAVDVQKEKRRAKRAEDDRIAKEQREEALKYETDRRAKRREADKAKPKDDRDRRVRKDEESEARRLEDKEDRRAAREARRREEEANRALEDDILKPRSKRRDTEKEVPAASSSRPRTSDRRRSHVDKATERPKSSRRKSTMAPVDDYFDPRNGRPVNENDPYGGNDHTASWVKSQVSEPPEPPPVEPTIMEQAPDFRAKGADDLMEDEYARRASHKKPKRSSRMYADPVGDEQEDRRRRRKEKEVRSSEGSAAEERYGGLGSMNRRQSDLGGVKLGAGAKTFDGKTGQGKRSSWFQKVTGF